MIRLGLVAPDPSAAIGAAANLRGFWVISGFGTGSLLEEAAICVGKQEGFQGLTICIWGLGAIALERSDHDAAQARYEEAQQFYRRVGNMIGRSGIVNRVLRPNHLH